MIEVHQRQALDEREVFKVPFPAGDGRYQKPCFPELTNRSFREEDRHSRSCRREDAGASCFVVFLVQDWAVDVVRWSTLSSRQNLRGRQIGTCS